MMVPGTRPPVKVVEEVVVVVVVVGPVVTIEQIDAVHLRRWAVL